MKNILIVGFSVFLPALAQTPADAIAERYQKLAQDGLAAAGTAGERLYALPGPAVVKNAPYSADAVTETTQTLADGNRIVRSTSQKLYRDSDGRERREQSIMAVGALAQPDPSLRITISDPVDNVTYSLNPRNKTALKSMRSGLGTVGAVPLQLEINTFQFGVTVLDPNSIRTREGGAPVKQDLGSRNIEGVIAKGTRTTRTIQAGEIGNQLPIDIVDEVWFSPDLQMNVMTTHTDPRSGETVYKLSNIVRANPARSFFEPPADYTITGLGAGGGRGRGPAPVPQQW